MLSCGDPKPGGEGSVSVTVGVNALVLVGVIVFVLVGVKVFGLVGVLVGVLLGVRVVEIGRGVGVNVISVRGVFVSCITGGGSGAGRLDRIDMATIMIPAVTTVAAPPNKNQGRRGDEGGGCTGGCAGGCAGAGFAGAGIAAESKF